MDPDMIRRMEQMQVQAAELGQLAAGLAAAAPRQAEGVDTSGWVQVAVGADGLPRTIRIRNGWNQRLEPERLAEAVMQAHGDAVSTATRAWSSQLTDDGWVRRRERMEHPAPDVSGQAGPVLPHGAVRETSALAEDVLAALHRVQQPPQAPAEGEGSDQARHVTVRVGQGGLLDCRIEPGWAARFDGDAITAALTTAVRAARTALPAPSAPDATAGDLAADALATLRALTENFRPGGETQ
jgi:DNA-binding protein YbaB